MGRIRLLSFVFMYIHLNRAFSTMSLDTNLASLVQDLTLLSEHGSSKSVEFNFNDLVATWDRGLSFDEQDIQNTHKKIREYAKVFPELALSKNDQEKFLQHVALFERSNKQFAYALATSLLYARSNLFPDILTVLATNKKYISTLARNVSGDYIAVSMDAAVKTADAVSEVSLWDIARSNVLHSEFFDSSIRSLAFSHKYLAVGQAVLKPENTTEAVPSSIYIFDIDKFYRVGTLMQHKDWVTALAFASDTMLASTSDDSSVMLFEPKNIAGFGDKWELSKELKPIDTNVESRTFGYSISFNSDTTLLASSYVKLRKDGHLAVEIWNVKDAKQIIHKIYERSRGITYPNVVVRFHPRDPLLLAVASVDNVTLMKVEAPSLGQELVLVKDFKRPSFKGYAPVSVVFNDTATKLAVYDAEESLDGGGKISVWDVDSTKLLGIIPVDTIKQYFCPIVYLPGDVIVSGLRTSEGYKLILWKKLLDSELPLSSLMRYYIMQ